MIGLRQHRSASCRIAEPEGVPEDMRSQLREVVGVQADEKRRGHASGLLHHVCAEADRDWLTLLIKVEPYADGMTLDQLERWYGSFGFVRFQTEPCVLMARVPVATPRLH